MRRRIRSEVTVETESLWMIRWRGRLAHTRCVVCAGDATLISLDEAVALSRISSRGIHRLAEAGEIHFQETSEGLLLVCLDSLLRELADKSKPWLIQAGLRGPP